MNHHRHSVFCRILSFFLSTLLLTCHVGIAEPAAQEPFFAAASPSDSVPISTPTVSPEPSPTPQPTDTSAPSAEPTATATLSPSDAPTETPSVAPTDSATPAPSPVVTPAPAPTEEPAVDGPIELFPAEEGDGRLRSKPSAPNEVVLKNQAYVIRRSGSYLLSGGGDSCSLTVEGDAVVSIYLRGASIAALSLGSNTVATISTISSTYTKIQSIIAGSSARLMVGGSGCLTVAQLQGNAEVTGGSVSLPSGSSSLNGYILYSVSAPGTVAATVNGTAWPYSMPNPDDGKAHLWLPNPADGAPYKSAIQGDTLVITSEPVQPPSSDTYSLSSTNFSPLADTSYRIVLGDAPQSQTLTINASGVSLTLDGLAAASYADVQANNETTLFLSSSNSLKSLAGSILLAGNGNLAVESLNASSLKARGSLNLRFSSGTPAGWQSVQFSGQMTSDTRAAFEGQKIAVAYQNGKTDTAYLPLPAPPSGMRYHAELSGNTLKVKTVTAGTQDGDVPAGGLVISQNGEYRLHAASGTTGNIEIQNNVKATLVLDDAELPGTLVLKPNSEISLVLNGSSRLGGISLDTSSKLTVTGAGAVLVGKVDRLNAALTVVQRGANFTLQNGISGTELPTSGKKATVILVTDASNQPKSNLPITLKVGTGEPFSTTTDRLGRVFLWENAPLDGVDAVVLSGSDTYATVLNKGQGEPDALPTLTNIKSLYSAILYTAQNAQTSGIQYYVNTPNVSIPDGYDPNAQRVLQLYGECNIPGLKNGDTVTFRVFACAKPGVELNAQTANAFRFSDQFTFIATDVRKVFTLPEQQKEYNGKPFEFAPGVLPQGATVVYLQGGAVLSNAPKEPGTYTARITVPGGNTEYLPGVTDVTVVIVQKRKPFTLPDQYKEYDGKSFRFSSGVLPANSTVSWTQKGKPLPSAPSAVGEYVAKVTVPEGNQTYLPGVYDVKVIIEGIVVWIYPMEYSKMVGDPDPEEFLFINSDLLPGDQITGKLTREPGEEFGNYPYLTDKLVAAPYYELVIDPESPMFFIDFPIPPGPRPGPYDPLNKIDPIHQVIRFSDGKTLDLILRTAEKLNISKVYYGNMLADEETGKVRPFYPSLRLRPGRDEVLLVLEAEPDLNSDGGYATDADGKLVRTGRVLTLSYTHLDHFEKQRITHIAFQSAGISCVLDLRELQSEAMSEWMKQNGVSKRNTRFQVILTPVDSGADVPQDAPSARLMAGLGEPLCNVSVVLRNGSNVLDITSVLQNALVLADASSLLTAGAREDSADTAAASQDQQAARDLLQGESLNKDVREQGPVFLNRAMQRDGYALACFGQNAVTLDSKPVVPYTATETQTALFTAMMRIAPYLQTPLRQNGVYGITLP